MRDRSTGQGVALQVGGVASVQFGAALAATLFPLVGPLGTVTLRLVGASLALALNTRPWRRHWTRASLRAAALFGLVLMGTNVCLYTAVSRLPLATAITLEFLGPLLLTVATATSWKQRAWALPAGVGVALLGGSMRLDDLPGVLAALTAAAGWATYIVLSRRMGAGTGSGPAGLCLGSALGALVLVPVGAVTAGAALVEPRVLVLGLAVGVLSSAVPYTLDLLALRRLPTAVFGVLTSLNPAVAALAGLLVLGETLPGRQLLGIACVTAAGAGVTLTSVARPRTVPVGQAARVARSVSRAV